MIRIVSGFAITRIHMPRGIPKNAPITIGITGFHSAFFAALGNIGVITKTSVDSASKTASLGDIRRLKNGTITIVAPKPANPLIIPPTATIASKGAQ